MSDNCGILHKPKTIKWFEMPAFIGEDDQIEFLKRDVLVVNCDGAINKIFNTSKSDNQNSIFFFNFDKILLRNNLKIKDCLAFAPNFIQAVQALEPTKSLVHTKIIDSRLGDIFKTEGISFIEQNLEDRTKAFNVTLKLIKPFFSQNNEVVRSFVRVNLYPMKYKVELIDFSNKTILATGVLKDISLNGIGLVLSSKDAAKQFNLKDKLTIKLYLRGSYIKINLGFLTRLDREKLELGVTFNINEQSMVGMLDADKISKIIYKYIKQEILLAGKNMAPV